MSKAINVRLPQLTFPKTCVVCFSPSSNEYEVEKTFSYGRRSYTVHVNVPMCAMHAEAANFKSPAERLVNGCAVFGGILAGLVAAGINVASWVSPEPFLVKLLGGSVFGFGAFILFWWIVSGSIAPLSAASRSKAARNAVRIKKYSPRDQIAQLEFDNESLAEIVLKVN